MDNANEAAGVAAVALTTLGDQVRGEARRRGGAWGARADELAARAVEWFGPRPCKGADLELVFGEIFRMGSNRVSR